MKLIPFATMRGVVYINPQAVFSVSESPHQPAGRTFTNIMTTSGFSYDVLEDTITVVKALMDNGA